MNFNAYGKRERERGGFLKFYLQER
jgi:hypothetical protein